MMEMGIESQPRPKAHKNATTDTTPSFVLFRHLDVGEAGGTQVRPDQAGRVLGEAALRRQPRPRPPSPEAAAVAGVVVRTAALLGLRLRAHDRPDLGGRPPVRRRVGAAPGKLFNTS